MKTLDPEEFSKADLMRHALLQNPDATRAEIGKLYGDEEYFSSSHFSTVRKEIRAEQKQLKLFDKREKKKEKAEKAEKAEKKNGTKVGASIAALQLENAYLRWQLEGERQGFFDRWLEEKDG